MTHGVDLSHHNGQIDWKLLSQTDIEFCFLKATESRTVKDETFSHNWDMAKTSGILRGAYHFYRPDVDAISQVDNFLSLTKFHYLPTDLPPVLDWELKGTHELSTQISGAMTWLIMVERALKKLPIIYTSPSVFTEIGNPAQFKQFPLWLAHYTLKPEPKIPKPWEKWAFWQYSESGHVSGIKGPVDMNWFNGSLDELKVLASKVL